MSIYTKTTFKQLDLDL